MNRQQSNYVSGATLNTDTPNAQRERKLRVKQDMDTSTLIKIVAVKPNNA